MRLRYEMKISKENKNRGREEARKRGEKQSRMRNSRSKKN